MLDDDMILIAGNSHQEKADFGRAVGRLHALGAVSAVLRRTRLACEACPAPRADSHAHLRVETRRHGIALFPLGGVSVILFST